MQNHKELGYPPTIIHNIVKIFGKSGEITTCRARQGTSGE